MTDEQLQANFTEIGTQFTQIGTQFSEIGTQFTEIRAEFRSQGDQIRGELRAEIRAQGDDLRRHFDVTAESMRQTVMVVAEAVLSVSDKLDREAADIRQEMRQGFADTQAMIKLSHGELDRRLTSVESGVAEIPELRGRVERIEKKLDR